MLSASTRSSRPTRAMWSLASLAVSVRLPMVHPEKQSTTDFSCLTTLAEEVTVSAFLADVTLL